MLLAGYVTAKGKNFKVRSSDNRQFTAKIHWAPPFAQNTAIVKALDPYGEVKTICCEKCKSQGFESVCSGIRSVVMTGDRRKVPHLITVTNPVTADKYELLVTIAVRPPPLFKIQANRSLPARLQNAILYTPRRLRPHNRELRLGQGNLCNSHEKRYGQ